MYQCMLPFLVIVLSVSTAWGEPSDEIAAIKKTARVYMEAWYQGDAKRMKGSLHKKLAKRSLKGPYGENELRHTTATNMVTYTRHGYGKGLWQKDFKIDVIVLDHYKEIASVKVIAPHYLEYLHLGKVDNRWVIINALYEKKVP